MVRAYWPILVILVVAAGLRFYRIAQDDFWYDELQSMESSAGRGWVEMNVPRDGVIEKPVRPGTLADAAPWWEIGSAMRQREVMPPGYFILLRWWREVFGDGEFAVRALSVMASVVGVGLIYFVAKELFDRPAAVWAAVLMAITPTQIQYAQEARAYAVATMFLLGALLAMVWIWRKRLSVVRAVALGACVFAAVLCHYFAIGPVIGIAIFSMILLRGRVRVVTLAAFGAAGIVYLAVWGPGMMAQHGNFQRDISGMGVVRPSIIDLTQWFLAALVSQISIFIPADEHRWILIVAGVVLLAAIVFAYINPRYAIGVLWVICGLGILAIIDSTGSSSSLVVPRYSVVTAPGILLMVAGALAGKAKLLRHLAPAALAMVCLCYLPHAYEPYKERWRYATGLIADASQPGDIIVIGSKTHRDWWLGRCYLGLVYYGADGRNVYPFPIVLASHPVEGTVLEELRRRRSFWVITDSSHDTPEFVVPGARVERYVQIKDMFELFRVTLESPGQTQ